MRGILKKKNDSWIVEYLQRLTVADTWIKELPLHPEDVKNLETGFTDKFTKEVEFEIVGDIKDLSNNGNLIQYAKLIFKQEELPESKVTRLEVIDHTPQGEGRAYSKHGIKSLELSYQDDDKTLKIFIK